MRAAVPDRANRMDDVARGQGKARGDACLAGRAAHARSHFGKAAARIQQGGAGCMMDGAIDPAATKQSRVRSINDGVNAALRNVSGNDGDRHGVVGVPVVCSMRSPRRF